jgi:hypothetical protein
VLLSGEAGIGKSRLTAALLERLATEPYTRLRYFCSPQHTDSALYPIIGQMERAAGLAPQAKLDKLDAVLSQTSTSKQDAALFAAMLSLPNDGRYPELGLECTVRDANRRQFDVVMAWNVDRLGRSLQDLVAFLSELQALKVDLFLYQQGLDTLRRRARRCFRCSASLRNSSAASFGNGSVPGFCGPVERGKYRPTWKTNPWPH